MGKTMDRRDAVKRIMDARPDALVVTGLGSPTYDVHAAGDRDGNFYLWGAMGGAALVGLGLAQSQPDRRVVVITGDGEQLMAMGAFATIGVAAPRNLEIFVLDNEHYGETGMQGSHTGQGVDFVRVAEGCKFTTAVEVCETAELEAAIASNANGPLLAVLKIRQENPPRSLPSRDAVFIKNRFRAYVGLD